MPSVIDPETINVDELPGIWSPLQWELTEDERAREIEQQATASLLHAVDPPEAILRLLLSETAIERAYDPPAGYDPERQGEWDPGLLTFQFSQPIRMVEVKREEGYLSVEYDFGEVGRWMPEIRQEEVSVYQT